MDPVGPMMQCNIKTQVPPLCAAMQCGSLPGSQGLSVLNSGSPLICSLLGSGSGCPHPSWQLVFGALHCHAGDIASAPGNGDVAVAQPATGCVLEKWRYHGTLLR